jgi:hypothetical protein
MRASVRTGANEMRPDPPLAILTRVLSGGLRAFLCAHARAWSKARLIRYSVPPSPSSLAPAARTLKMLDQCGSLLCGV